MLRYTPKTGTRYILKVRNRALPGDIQERIEGFKANIKAIDKKKKPKKNLLSKSPEKYELQHKDYIKELKKECSKVLTWIGADKKRAVSSSRPLLTQFRKSVADLDYSPDYYLYLLKNLKAENPKHVRVFEALEGKTGLELSQAMIFIKEEFSDRMPDSLKKKISSLPYQHPAIKFLKLSQSATLKFKKESKENSLKMHKKPVTFKINEIRKTAEAIIKNRDACDWNLLVCAVVALTGRRPIEVIKTGSFTKASKANHVMFYGQAKIRGREDEPREIPVIGSTPKDIIDSIKILREERDYSEYTNDQINNTTSMTANTMLRKHFKNQSLDLKTLRTIYAVVLDKEFYETYGVSVSKPLYISHALGHSSEDVNTQTRYAWIKPDWSDAQALNVEKEEEDKKQKGLNKLIEIIEASRPAIMRLQQRGNAFETLTDWLIEELKAGNFVSKTEMERDPETRESRRSRKTVEAFIKALRLPKDWPKSVDDIPMGQTST